MSKIHRFSLPAPKSANQLFRNATAKEIAAGQGGRKKTKAYDEWIAAALERLTPQKNPHCLGRVSITIYVGEESTKVQDIDNCTKATVDALVKARIIPDDKRVHVRGVQTVWVVNMAGMAVTIEEDPAEVKAAEIIALLPENARRLMA